MVAPATRRNTSARASASVAPSIRFLATESKAMTLPSPLMATPVEAPSAWAPAELTLTRVVVCATRSRTNTSETPLVSPATRLVASLWKTT